MDTSPTPLVEIDHVTKSFGQKVALKYLSFSVPTGQLCGLLGPISWLPVALVGLASALVFKKTGRLGPSVMLHMVYNAVVIAAMR